MHIIEYCSFNYFLDSWMHWQLTLYLGASIWLLNVWCSFVHFLLFCTDLFKQSFFQEFLPGWHHHLPINPSSKKCYPVQGICFAQSIHLLLHRVHASFKFIYRDWRKSGEEYFMLNAMIECRIRLIIINISHLPTSVAARWSDKWMREKIIFPFKSCHDRFHK